MSSLIFAADNPAEQSDCIAIQKLLSCILVGISLTWRLNIRNAAKLGEKLKNKFCVLF
jgi:hypothetical protein